MSAVVKLTSALPGDEEYNGLDAIIEALLEHPEAIRSAYIEFDVAFTKDVTDTAKKIPHVRVRRFEPLGEAGQIKEELRRAYEKAFAARTGREPLPGLGGSDEPEGGE